MMKSLISGTALVLMIAVTSSTVSAANKELVCPGSWGGVTDTEIKYRNGVITEYSYQHVARPGHSAGLRFTMLTGGTVDLDSVPMKGGTVGITYDGSMGHATGTITCH